MVLDHLSKFAKILVLCVSPKTFPNSKRLHCLSLVNQNSLVQCWFFYILYAYSRRMGHFVWITTRENIVSRNALPPIPFLMPWFTTINFEHWIILVNISDLSLDSLTLFQSCHTAYTQDMIIKYNLSFQSSKLGFTRSCSWENFLPLALLHCFMTLISSHHVFHCIWRLQLALWLFPKSQNT